MRTGMSLAILVAVVLTACSSGPTTTTAAAVKCDLQVTHTDARGARVSECRLKSIDPQASTIQAQMKALELATRADYFAGPAELPGFNPPGPVVHIKR
ncbi:MAG: hypothetical protein HYX47_16985 [Burkholderiales bacterium]|nr:hypothetical protein [Burkholderiales bacterium]